MDRPVRNYCHQCKLYSCICGHHKKEYFKLSAELKNKLYALAYYRPKTLPDEANIILVDLGQTSTRALGASKLFSHICFSL